MAKENKNKSHIKKIAEIVVVLLAIIFFVIYQFLGYKHYYSAVLNIKSSSPENQKFGKNMFYGNSNSKTTYNGTLAFITKYNKSNPIIWIWGKNGLRYFKVDNRTVFSNYRICQGEDWKTGKGTVSRNSDIGLEVWLSNVEVGDFVGVDAGGVFFYDWWIFKPYSTNELIKLCENR